MQRLYFRCCIRNWLNVDLIEFNLDWLNVAAVVIKERKLQLTNLFFCLLYLPEIYSFSKYK